MTIGSFLFHRAEDAVLPGSGEVTSILEKLRPLLPYVIGVIAILLLVLLIWRAPWAESRQKAKDAARYEGHLTLATQRMVHATVVLAGADSMMRQQSASIRTHAALANKAVAHAHDLELQAQAHDASYSARIAKLQNAKPDGPPCPSVREVEEDWK